MSARSIPSDFVKSVLSNGVGRYVVQLQRITFKFCKSHSDSRGIRDFIESELLQFTRLNPGIVVYLQPRRHHAPRLVAEYLNGNTVHLNVANKPKEELCEWIGHLRSRSGVDIVRLRKMWHTDSPSVQGVWTPFANKDSRLNVTEFPDSENFRWRAEEESASERLMRSAERLRPQTDDCQAQRSLLLLGGDQKNFVEVNDKEN